MFQNDVNEVCDVMWGERRAPWSLICILNITFHVLFAVYVIGISGGIEQIGIIWTIILFMPFIFVFPCIFSSSLTYASLSYYCLSKFTFTAFLFDLSTNYDPYVGDDFMTIYREVLKLQWFHEGACVTFTSIHYSLSILIDAASLGFLDLLNFDYLTGFVGNWATTCVVTMSLAVSWSCISKVLTIVSRCFVLGTKDPTQELWRTNTSSSERLSMMVLCFTAYVLTDDSIARINNFKVISLLLIYEIALINWESVEADYSIVVNSGNTNKYTYIRLFAYAAILTTVSTIMIFRAANHFDYNVWLLFSASGNSVLLCRIFFKIIELALLHLLWYPETRFDMVEDTIYFVRLFRNILIGVLVFLWKYYFAHIPVFSKWFYIIIIVSTLDGAWSFNRIIYKEWLMFQKRRQFLNGLGNLEDASEEQLDDLQDVCSICFSEIHEGKLLQCSHIFHYICLRRWFQVRSSCPVCNNDVILL